MSDHTDGLYPRYLKYLWIAILLLLLIACAKPAQEDPPRASPQVASPAGKAFVLGDISDDPAEVIEGTQPLADYLAARLGELGITEGRVVVASDADAMIQHLERGEVDLYCDSVYPATLISDASGAQPILRRWRFGVEEYHSVIFARAESGITALADLPGHMIALDNRFSTSGYLLPVVTLLKEDLTLVGKASTDAPVAEDEVGFIFSYDDENTLQWVLRGRVAAGATDDYHYEIAFPAEARENLVMLAETESVPRQVVVARPDMDPALLEAVKQILTSAHEDEAAHEVLNAFQTTRFDEFPEGIQAAQARMRAMMEIVQDIPMSEEE